MYRDTKTELTKFRSLASQSKTLRCYSACMTEVCWSVSTGLRDV